MSPPIFSAPPFVSLPPPEPAADSSELLRQLLEVQREQLNFWKGQAQQQDGAARSRAFLARWEGEFPDIGQACKQVLPAVERAYLTMIRELTDKVIDAGPEGLDSDFELAEFLDRYGVRLGQLGTLLGQLGPLADAAPAPAPEPGG